MSEYDTIHRCKDCNYETSDEANIIEHCKIPIDKSGSEGIVVKNKSGQIITYYIWRKGKNLDKTHKLMYGSWFTLYDIEIKKNKKPEESFKTHSNYKSIKQLDELKKYFKGLNKKELKTLKGFLLKTDYGNSDCIKNLETI